MLWEPGRVLPECPTRRPVIPVLGTADLLLSSLALPKNPSGPGAPSGTLAQT